MSSWTARSFTRWKRHRFWRSDGEWNSIPNDRTRRWATGHRRRKPSFQNRSMEMWKTKPVPHISTPPTTTDIGQKRRYTNIPLGTKKRSGHFDLQGWPMPEPPLQSQPAELALHPRLLHFQVSISASVRRPWWVSGEQLFCKSTNVTVMVVDRRKQFLIFDQSLFGAPLHMASK